MSIGLFIGRFQPFHKGHLAIVKLALEQVDFLKIVLGTKQESRTSRNPLSWEERSNIIKACLEDEGISNFEIFTLDDIPDNNAYPSYVRGEVGPFDVVFTGENELVKQLFSASGYSVIDSDRLNGWMATEIRDRIIAGKDYSSLVPKRVFELLESGLKKFIS